MSLGKITVIGSINTDMVIKSPKLPSPGETILGGKFLMNHGGKGANQAVAAARLGGKVTFIGKTGNDIFGKQAKQLLEEEKINIRHISTDKNNPSGVAMITVDKDGENCIVVAPGSNSTLSVSDIDAAKEDILSSHLILIQLEIPLATVIYAAKMAFDAGIRVVLNPAPACALPDELYQNLYCITPNVFEAEMLSGISIVGHELAAKAADIIFHKGVPNVIVTLGAKGAYLLHKDCQKLIKAPKVETIDTTAAGDVFNGALALALAENRPIEEAVDFANKAASVCVTRMGAQSSIPYWYEIK